MAVIGSLLSSRYEVRVAGALAPFHVPAQVEEALRSSLGAALAVAHQVGGVTGAALAGAARAAFISGMDLGLTAAAAVGLAAAAVAAVTIPARDSPRRRR